MPDPLEPARAMWAADAASAALGIRLDDLGPGRARVSMVVRDDMVNGHDLCHGGLIATLADSAFALACNSRGPVTVAAGFTVDFVQPGRLGQTLHAEAREVTLRGRSGLYDVTVRADDPEAGEVVAEFRGRSRSLGRPSEPGPPADG
ncbi:hydroxyphenylacetyl-CoA thioesterase PaaI [Nocardioides sp. J2M5]|uniref:hydroxyphenylacetyl-CoA thioesterase PaaI n=1 Tax=Nocardioides palaemonis TaxID=2829810 RepID=UPI001BAD6B94|nr:hydroxyphenylacetyl-CoA thioesterase PaaI [Nocardioides palaemonis]MBS2938834.1 hydroxyphenylacetyl-CoA thioesterase PaaI [Nocardioides palaemonis]